MAASRSWFALAVPVVGAGLALIVFGGRVNARSPHASVAESLPWRVQLLELAADSAVGSAARTPVATITPTATPTRSPLPTLPPATVGPVIYPGYMYP